MRREYKIVLFFFIAFPATMIAAIWIRDYNYAFKTNGPIYIDFQSVEDLKNAEDKYVVLTNAEISACHITHKEGTETEYEIYFMKPKNELISDTVYAFIQWSNEFPYPLFYYNMDKWGGSISDGIEGQLKKGVYLEDDGDVYIKEEYSITYNEEESYILYARKTPSYVSKRIYLWTSIILIVSLLVDGALYRYMKGIEERERKEGRGIKD